MSSRFGVGASTHLCSRVDLIRDGNEEIYRPFPDDLFGNEVSLLPLEPLTSRTL